MSVATVVTEGFGTFGTINFVVTQGFGSSGDVTPPVVTPTSPSVTTSGVKRRTRVRRSDFSSQENYELALRAAFNDARFAIRETPDETPAPPPRRARSKPEPKVIPVDKSLSRKFDTEIHLSEADFYALQHQTERETLKMLSLFITIIESEDQ